MTREGLVRDRAQQRRVGELLQLLRLAQAAIQGVEQGNEPGRDQQGEDERDLGVAARVRRDRGARAAVAGSITCVVPERLARAALSC